MKRGENVLWLFRVNFLKRFQLYVSFISYFLTKDCPRMRWSPAAESPSSLFSALQVRFSALAVASC